MSKEANESFQGEEPHINTFEQSNPSSPGLVEENIQWVDYAVQQAKIAQKNIESTLETTIEATRSRVDRILTTSSAHFNQTLGTLQEVKSEYGAYEDIFFSKIKEGCLLASSHPVITAGTIFGVGVLGLKKPRKFMYYKSMRLVFSEETLISRADAKVKELRNSLDLLKAESEKLEHKAMQAEAELMRGRTKLKQAGKQIQSAISSGYKIERQAAGLKDVLKELPSREASRFRTEVTNLGKEAKKERNVLSKEVTKISNYGISV